MQIVIDTYGASLSRNNHIFEICTKDGKKKRITPDSVSSIIISKGIILSSDALLLALENDIEVILVGRSGKPLGRIWNGKFGSIATIRKKQMQFAQSAQGAIWTAKWIQRKMNEQLSFIYQLLYGGWVEDSLPTKRKIETMNQNILKIDQFISQTIPQNWQATLRGWEGTTSAAYFNMIAASLPISFQFRERTRPAKDLFNCLLNYLYGILYGKVEEVLIKAGIDPSIGIFHADEYAKPVLTYDFIEPYRIWADTIAVRLCFAQALEVLTHFQPTPQNKAAGIWLNSEGKKVVIQAFNNYIEEVINRNQLMRSRSTHLFLDAQTFAQELLKFEIITNH